MSHKGKTALVTGACGGLGRHIAERFLEDGCNVVVCDINEQLIAEFKDQVSARYTERTLVVRCDVTSDAGLDDLFQQAEKTFGPLHFAINNCGIMDKFDPVGDMDRALWDKVIAINLTAPAMVSKRAVNAMLKHKVKGSIVNISSVAGNRGFVSGAAYVASKHGLLGLTKNTGSFYGPKGIRCNAIMAGYMQTNIASSMANGLNMEGFGAMRAHYPEATTILVSTEKVAKLVSYLCSDDAEIVTGACWTADGGWTAA